MSPQFSLSPSRRSARLMSALPESLWAEANRRLRLVPDLWALAETPAILDAWCAIKAEARWQPGPLALAAYAVRHPECEGEPEAWLLSAGRDRVSQAYFLLTQPSGNSAAGLPVQLHPIDDALPAALAMRLRGYATKDWLSMAQEAAHQPERWRLSLQYLWGLSSARTRASTGEQQVELFRALLQHNPTSAELAGQCLAVNLAEQDAIQFVANLDFSSPPSHSQWLAFANSIEALGETAYARSILREGVALPMPPTTEAQPSDDPAPLSPFRLASAVEAARLLAAAGHSVAARSALEQVWAQARRLRADIAVDLGELAMHEADPVAAFAAYQDALSERPANPGIIAGLSRALLQLGRPAEALAHLQPHLAAGPLPSLAVVAAQAHKVLGQIAEVNAALERVNFEAESDSATLAEAAQLYFDLDQRSAAFGLIRRAAEMARTNPDLYLTAAHWMLDANQPQAASEMATEAAALMPENAEVRETLGRALLASGAAAQAIPHFRAAVVFDAERLSAALGLARAALAAEQPALARETLERVLAPALSSGLREEARGEAALEGEAHTLMGQALSALRLDDRAFEHFRRASALVPTAPEPWRAMARHYQNRGERDQALAVLEAGRQALALIASPHALRAPLLADLAAAYETAGRFTEAIVALREACTADPQARWLGRLGRLLRQQGHPIEAIEALRQALLEMPGDASTWHELGLALENSAQAEAAWSAYQQAVLAHPTVAAPYLDLGRLTLAQCRYPTSHASPQQAITALTAAIEYAPEEAEAHALLAQAHHLAGDPESALACYQRALHLAPTRTEWSLDLGQVCLELGRTEAAITALRSALDHAPDEPQVNHALARAYAQSGLWPEARQHIQAALRFAPDDPPLLDLLAEAYTRLGDAGQAVEAWRQAVALNPRDAQMQVKLGRGLLAAGLTEAGRAALAQALSLAPDSADVHLAAGTALFDLGEVEKAHHVLARAVELDPHGANAHAALGRAAMQTGRCEAAYGAYLRAADLEAGPTRAAHLREAAEAAWVMGRQASAIATWQRALLLTPNHAALLTRLGTALAQLGHFAEAMAVLETAAAQNPNEAGMVREAARVALALGNHARAVSYLEGLLAAGHPNDAEAHYLLGRAREGQGQTDEALALYRRAARLCPKEGRYLAAAAETVAKQGHLDEATSLIENALSVSPESAEVLALAGDIYLRAGQAKTAAVVLGKLAAARPRDPAAQLALARALVLLAEAEERDLRAGLRLDAPSDPARLLTTIQKAAALGAEALAVRYWLGRAKAVCGDPLEACALLASMLDDPSFVKQAGEVSRALGVACRKAGDKERALQALQAALQADPESAATHLEMGLCLSALGDGAGALAAFKRAASAAPEWAIAQYHLAEALMALGESRAATTAMQRALTLRPEAAAWHYRLAKMLHGLGESSAALGHLQRAVELDPSQAGYAADLGQALMLDGDAAAAVELFRRATSANPDSAPLWAEQGQAHLALGDFNSAAACFARAILLAPTHLAALLGSARTSLALGDLHDAANKAEAAARLAPEDPEVMMGLAEVQAARGEADKAEASYALAISRSPRPASAMLALGRLHLTTGRAEKALGVLEQAAAAAPDDDGVLALLGEVRQATGDLEGAVSAYRQAARIASRSPRHLLKLGSACRAQGQLDQALAHLLQARELAPHDEDVLRETGLVFEQRKQLDRALDLYRLAIQAAPNSAQNHIRLGVALKQLKDYEGALAALERAVSLEPKNLEATKQLAVVSALNLMHRERARV